MIIPETLYHVTFLKDLESIQVSGLKASSGSVFGGGYSGHSRDRLFFTEWDGIPFWFGGYQAIAESETDNPETGWSPVVLSLFPESVGKLEKDELGSRDSLADAFYVQGGKVLPDALAVWDGDSWELLEDVDPESMLEGLLEASTYEEDPDEEEGGWWFLDETYFAPDEEDTGE